MKSMIRVGNGAGFLGDQLDAPRELLEQGALDYLTLEYLAELTLSILAHQKERDPLQGYATDFVTVFPGLIPALQAQPQVKIVTNAGGIHPTACAERIARSLHDANAGETRIAVVTGDNLLSDRNAFDQPEQRWEHFDSGQPLDSARRGQLVSANAYLGAAGIVEALSQGARIVITGRVADASLTVGPAIYEFGWRWDDWQRLSAASVAGHVIECGAQATGGMFSAWSPRISLANVGYPIAEISADGEVVITKPSGTGGIVDARAVSEQLVYEIGDPAHYITPDVDVDFRELTLAEIGPDRVRIQGARGQAPPTTYKVSMAYRDGWTATGTLVICGREAPSVARQCGEIILERVRNAGYELDHAQLECLGQGDSLRGVWPIATECREVVLRISVRDARREAVDRFVREFAPLVTSGPPGVTGYTGSRVKPRPVLSYWPSRIEKTRVTPRVMVHSASDWIDMPLRAKTP